MDAITLLKDDHKTVEKLFKRFEKAGERAFVEKRRLVDQIIEELSVHAAIEEQYFYPVIRATVSGTEAMTLESLEEHHIVKWVLDELDGLDHEYERFDAKVTVLIENVRHHVKEEEQDLFPEVRDALGRSVLGDLGDAMVAAKDVAPTHPHPTAPDTPPGNKIVGAAAGVADRVGDTVSGVAQGSATAVGDLIALVLQRKKPRVSAQGSPQARRTAAKVRAGASDAAEAVTDAVRDGERTVQQTAAAAERGAQQTAHEAKRTTTRTVSAARSGAKGTATSARRGARDARSTAKRGATTTGRTARSGATKTARTAKSAAEHTVEAAQSS